jgi:transposase
VKTTVRRRGDRTYTYLSLVEAERRDGRVVHNTLFRLGEASELRESGQLDRIIAALRSHAEATWVSASEMTGEDAPAFGSVAAVDTLFGRLGLDRHFEAVGAKRKAQCLADTIEVLVANRLCAPGSKRRTIVEWLDNVALPESVAVPSLDQCYRAIDALADAKAATEEHLYAALTDLTNLDLRLVCYDLTSTYFETASGPSTSFPSRAFGYSRDHRSDRPQVVIGLLVTGDGIPIAHEVFAGNTADVSTLPGRLEDLQARFGVGKIAVVADRGLISEANLDAVVSAGFEHVIATRLHQDHDVAAVLEAADGTDLAWVGVDQAGTTAAEITHQGRRYVVVSSPARKLRDDARREQLLTRTEDRLVALAERVSSGRLKDPAKISVAADRILRDSGVGRCFKTHVRAGAFSWDFDPDVLRYEEQLLAGRYVITTSLGADQADTATLVAHYKSLQNVERRFRVLKDFLALRPVYHWTEKRVRGHIALCVLAAVIEAVIAKTLAQADVRDPDLEAQHLTARHAIAELTRIRRATISAGDRHITVITRRNGLQAAILAALQVDTSGWDKATITPAA